MTPILTYTSNTAAIKATLFRSFSDRSRLLIFEALRDGPLTVGTSVEKIGLSRTNVSNHLRCLADCDLVISALQGRSTFYHLSDPRVAKLLGLADELLADVVRRVYKCTRYVADNTCMHEEGEDR